MMAEIPESEATGTLADIHAALRTYCAVPYVSSLQRDVATLPGCLECLWAVFGPAFRAGTLPETAWRLSPPAMDLRPPTDNQARAIIAAIHVYRVTSPEMIVFGSLLRDALPSAEATA